MSKRLEVFRERLLYLFEDIGDTLKRKVKVRGNHTLSECRTRNSSGYYVVRVDGALHYVHRLLHLMRYVSWPVGELDHIDGVVTNNAASNLREVTSSENSWNLSKSKFNKSGFTGASWCKMTESWRGSIKVSNTLHQQTGFTTALEAHEWYKSKVLELRGVEFAYKERAL